MWQWAPAIREWKRSQGLLTLDEWREERLCALVYRSPKPRIFRAGALWRCGAAYGRTPQEAYFAYQHLYAPRWTQ